MKYIAWVVHEKYIYGLYGQHLETKQRIHIIMYTFAKPTGERDAGIGVCALDAERVRQVRRGEGGRSGGATASLRHGEVGAFQRTYVSTGLFQWIDCNGNVSTH